MKLSKTLLVLAALPAYSLSFNPFRATIKTQHITVLKDRNQTPELPANININLNELLDSRTRKPEIYTKAMIELKRLEEQPICHRMAAQLLMNNCRGVENVQGETFQWDSGVLQQNVESFSASLSMCDLEKGKFKIPSACVPLSSTALYQAVRLNQGKIDIDPEQVGDCLAALAQDHSQWNTWLSNRDKALLFCRAARLDIDKDQAILLHKKLTEIMEIFTAELDEDLRLLHLKFAQHTDEADNYFEKMGHHTETLKTKLQNTFDSVSTNAKGVDKTMCSIVQNSNDALRIMRNFIQTMVQGNAEMAAEQQAALAVSTSNFETRIGSINSMVGETEATVLMMKDTLLELVPMVINLHERQDALDERSQAVLLAVMNATDLLQSHTHKLEQASTKAAFINNDLEKAAFNAKSWSESLGLGVDTQDMLIRMSSPVVSLFLGGYGLPATLKRNAFLLSSGSACAELYIRIRDAFEEARSAVVVEVPVKTQISGQETTELIVNGTPINPQIVQTPTITTTPTSTPEAPIHRESSSTRVAIELRS